MICALSSSLGGILPAVCLVYPLAVRGSAKGNASIHPERMTHLSAHRAGVWTLATHSATEASAISQPTAGNGDFLEGALPEVSWEKSWSQSLASDLASLNPQNCLAFKITRLL